MQRFKVWESSGRMGLPPTTYRGPADAIWTILRKEGGMLGLATGLRACMLRDAVGCGTMFAVYEGLKSSYVQLKMRCAFCMTCPSIAPASLHVRLDK